MKTNIYELKDWQSGARRVLSSRMDGMKDEMEQMGNYMRALDVTDELCAEIDNLPDEFKTQQFMEVFGVSQSAAWKSINRFVKDGFVGNVKYGLYRKLRQELP